MTTTDSDVNLDNIGICAGGEGDGCLCDQRAVLAKARLDAAEEVIHAETEYRRAKNAQRPGPKQAAAERRAAARTAWHALGGTNDG